MLGSRSTAMSGSPEELAEILKQPVGTNKKKANPCEEELAVQSQRGNIIPGTIHRSHRYS